MPIRAMVFDLFDTLVDLHFDASDTTEVAGKRVHSFVLRLHQALRERAEVDFETFMEAVYEVDRTEGRPRYKEGREFPTVERFESVVRLLGLEDPELPEILTSAHMSGIYQCAIVLPHHREILDRLGRRAKVGLCSNFSHSGTALRVIEEAGLHPHLDAVVISEAVGFRKPRDRKSTRLNSSHVRISYAVFCLKKKTRRVDRYDPADPRGRHYAFGALWQCFDVEAIGSRRFAPTTDGICSLR